MARLFAVVAESLGRRAHLGIVSNIAALVASATSQGRHVGLLLLRSRLNSFLLHIECQRPDAVGILGSRAFCFNKLSKVTIVEVAFGGTRLGKMGVS
jgi:hypothetical protein